MDYFCLCSNEIVIFYLAPMMDKSCSVFFSSNIFYFSFRIKKQIFLFLFCFISSKFMFCIFPKCLKYITLLAIIPIMMMSGFFFISIFFLRNFFFLYIEHLFLSFRSLMYTLVLISPLAPMVVNLENTYARFMHKYRKSTMQYHMTGCQHYKVNFFFNSVLFFDIPLLVSL